MMKAIISLLLLVELAVSEVPPPYPPRGFRPSPPFTLPVRQPQTTYGVPNAAPSKFSQLAPQTQYGAPNQQGSNLTPSFSSKQTIPNTSYGVPVTSSPYRTITSEPQSANVGLNQRPTVNSKQTIPSTSYGVPVTTSPYKTIVNEPQVSYGAPNTPNLQYDTSDARNIETLEQIRQLNLLLRLSQSSKSNQEQQIGINLSQSQNSNGNIEAPNQQYLPSRQAPDFQGGLPFQTSQRNIGQPAQQYLPVKEPTNFRNGFRLPGSNLQEPFDARVSTTDLRQVSQPNLPVNGGINFGKDLASPQTVNNPNINYQEPENSQNKVVDINQQRLPNINPNIALQSQSIKPNLNNYNNRLRNNVEIEQLNVRRLQNPNKIQTPGSQNIVPPQSAQSARQFVNSNVQGPNTEQINEKYLPPTTTVRSPSLPKDAADEDTQSTEPKVEGGPNVAIATAVSGVPGGQNFYVLQPDGRLQRVIYQKSRAEGDSEHEYTANYLFQNIQANPGLVYSPLITLGKR